VLTMAREILRGRKVTEREGKVVTVNGEHGLSNVVAGPKLLVRF